MSRIPLQMALESAKLEQSALLEFFDVDLTPLGGDMLRFHCGTNELRNSVLWKGNQYQPFPVSASGFEMSGTGTSNRPKFVVSNVSGLITGLINDFDDLVGAVVTRRLVFAKHLDSENFKGGNPLESHSQEILFRYIIERTVSIDSDFVAFELSLPCETDGAIIPARVIISDICSWQYRSVECSYVGGACADFKDEPTSDLTLDQCGKRLSSCKLRFGRGVLPFGGFPTASKGR